MRYKLGEIFNLQMGKTPDRHSPKFWNEGTEPWISIADLTKCIKYIENTAEKITATAVDESGIKIIPKNTVIMSFKLSIGKVAITPKEMYSNEAIMSFIDKGVLKQGNIVGIMAGASTPQCSINSVIELVKNT